MAIYLFLILSASRDSILSGYGAALRPTPTEGVFDVFSCREKVADIDFNDHNSNT
jgi:hypothetical protein